MNGEDLPESDIIVESAPNSPKSLSDNTIGVRTSKFKYFRNKNDSTINVNLFNLQKDPLELQNIAKENPSIVSEMENHMTKIQDSL